MPACLKSWQLAAYGNSITTPVFLSGTAVGGGGASNTKAIVLVPDSATTDLAKCAAVSLSGAEYQTLVSRITALEGKPTGSNGESTVNVTADIFVAAALVCIFVLGWIAGAQR